MNNEKTQDTPDQIAGERALPSVNSVQRSSPKRLIGAAFFLIALAVTALIGYRALKDNGKRGNVAQRQIIDNAVPARTFDLPPPPPSAPAPVTAVPRVAGGAPPPVGAAPAPAQGQPAHKPAVLDKSAAPLMASGAQGSGSGANSRQPLTATTAPGNTSEGLAAQLLTVATPGQRAKELGDRNMILAKGAFIDCVLQTRLDTTVAGMTSCVVSRDIFSDNGKVKLIEKGSLVTGEYQSTIRQGMARIFVLWNRVKTTNGVVVDLASPGADSLGGAGVPGYIDTHFWDRFGGAIMLSLVDDAFAALATRASGSDGSYVSGQQMQNTSNATQSMAAEALRATINIPPTLYKNQGEKVGIYVARDLDFSQVYEVGSERR